MINGVHSMTFAKILRALALLSDFGAVCVAIALIGPLIQGQKIYCWTALGIMMVSGNLAFWTLVLVIIPTTIRYHRNRHPYDRLTAWLAVGAMLCEIAVAVLVNLAPQSGE